MKFPLTAAFFALLVGTAFAAPAINEDTASPSTTPEDRLTQLTEDLQRIIWGLLDTPSKANMYQALSKKEYRDVIFTNYEEEKKEWQMKRLKEKKQQKIRREKLLSL